jgi:hypothetical protein
MHQLEAKIAFSDSQCTRRAHALRTTCISAAALRPTIAKSGVGIRPWMMVALSTTSAGRLTDDLDRTGKIVAGRFTLRPLYDF